MKLFLAQKGHHHVSKKFLSSCTLINKHWWTSSAFVWCRSAGQNLQSHDLTHLPPTVHSRVFTTWGEVSVISPGIWQQLQNSWPIVDKVSDNPNATILHSHVYCKCQSLFWCSHHRFPIIFEYINKIPFTHKYIIDPKHSMYDLFTYRFGSFRGKCRYIESRGISQLPTPRVKTGLLQPSTLRPKQASFATGNAEACRFMLTPPKKKNFPQNNQPPTIKEWQSDLHPFKISN